MTPRPVAVDPDKKFVPSSLGRALRSPVLLQAEQPELRRNFFVGESLHPLEHQQVRASFLRKLLVPILTHSKRWILLWQPQPELAVPGVMPGALPAPKRRWILFLQPKPELAAMLRALPAPPSTGSFSPIPNPSWQ